MPRGWTVEAQEEAVLALVVLAPELIEDAVRVLRRLPRYRDRDEDVVRNVATWARHLYPAVAAGAAWLEPSPDFLLGALLARVTEPSHAGLLRALKLGKEARRSPRPLFRLARATAQFPSLGALIETMLTTSPKIIPAVIEHSALLGSEARILQPILAAALTDRAIAVAEATRLLALIDPSFRILRIAVQRSAILQMRQDSRTDESVETQAALAERLAAVGLEMIEVGEPGAARGVLEEAVALHRILVEHDPGRLLPDLGRSLTHLAIALRDMGMPQKALVPVREAVALYRGLAEREPDRHTEDLANSLSNLGRCLTEAGELREGVAAVREAAGLQGPLAQQDPGRYAADHAGYLINLGGCLLTLGEPRQALGPLRMAVVLGKILAKHEPARFTPTSPAPSATSALRCARWASRGTR